MAGASIFNPRDGSRTSVGKTGKMKEKFRSPPRYAEKEFGQAWAWFTEELLSSPAFRSLSTNAMRSFFRIVVEYLKQGRERNGNLIVTHDDFVSYGVTQNLVADALDELQFKGLIKVIRGRGADGTPHPNRFRLTYLGCDDGSPWTNEWRGASEEHVARWSEARARLKSQRAKKKASLTEVRMSHSQKCECAPDFQGSGQPKSSIKSANQLTRTSVSTINISPEGSSNAA